MNISDCPCSASLVRIYGADYIVPSLMAKPGAPMRVLIADDHELLRDTLEAFLQLEDGIESVSAGTLEQACALIETDGPFDLVLLDYLMPGMEGLQGLTRALEIGEGQRVALMSGVASREIAERALEAGAAGFIPKTMAAKSMVNAIAFMSKGEQFVPVDFLTSPGQAESNALIAQLSRRELQVLRGLTKGMSNKEIARDIGLQEPTVKLHVKTLYRKVGAANRTQAAMIGREAGIY